MGVLDNTTITVDAILTKKGRELLAKGDGQFKITKFALADDEIDYGLYDITHPNGSNFYGAAIENMNLLEAIPNGNLAVKYFLTDSIQEGSDAPQLTINGASTIDAGGFGIYTGQTQNYGDEIYNWRISSTQYAYLGTSNQTGGNTGNMDKEFDEGYSPGGTTGGGTDSAVGASVTITCRPSSVLNGTDRQITLYAEGQSSGAPKSINITLKA